MPPKRKTNGFMVYTLDWKSKYGQRLSLREATTEAGKVWANMSAIERGPYNERAKKEKINLAENVEKLTCTGMPVSLVEKTRQDADATERQMKRYIETTVRNSMKKDELELHSYFFIMVNYFTKTLKGGVYVPAEISVAEFSLKEGVCRKYHCFINPGANIYGHHYEAKIHSETTHQLPLPPNAKGETNLGKIYNDVLNFIYDKETGEYPPIYTHVDSMPIVASVLDFLKSDNGAEQTDLKVYSLQHLFFIMKEATCEVGEIEKPKSHFITDAYFERDFFEYQTGMACTYHEDIDKSKYCTQACVTRWGYLFADYMCRDIAISLIPGRHLPEAVNIGAITNPTPKSFHDTESYVSVTSGTSFATNPILGNKSSYFDDKKSFSAHDYDDERLRGSRRPQIASDDDFPSLGASRKKPATTPASQVRKTTRISKDFDSHLDSDNSDLNPWASRSRNVPREPDTSHFNIDYTRDGDLSEFEYNSVASYGRGRVKVERSPKSTIGGGSTSGRGRLFRQFDY